MTLALFTPEALDELALRLLDLASRARVMAQKSRENELDSVQLHAQKVQEWLGRLDEWSIDAEARLEGQIRKRQGARRAADIAAQLAKPGDE